MILGPGIEINTGFDATTRRQTAYLTYLKQYLQPLKQSTKYRHCEKKKKTKRPHLTSPNESQRHMVLVIN